MKGKSTGMRRERAGARGYHSYACLPPPASRYSTPQAGAARSGRTCIPPLRVRLPIEGETEREGRRQTDLVTVAARQAAPALDPAGKHCGRDTAQSRHKQRQAKHNHAKSAQRRQDTTPGRPPSHARNHHRNPHRLTCLALAPHASRTATRQQQERTKEKTACGAA